MFAYRYLVATSTTHLEPDGAWSYAEAITVDAGSNTGSATIKTSAEVTNHGKTASTVTVRATITDSASGSAVGNSVSPTVTVAPGATMVANTSKALQGLSLWSVKKPSLYTVTVPAPNT
jgi:hypothetical protein